MSPGGNKLQIFLEVDARDGTAVLRDFGKASEAAGKSVDRAGRFMRQTQTAADRLRRTVRSTTTVIRSFASGITRVARNVFSLRGALVGLGLGLVAKSFLDVARETENYKVRLSTLLGSQQAANQAMRTFEQIARTVPFSLGEVVNAGTQLEAFGASHEVWLKPLTDLAAVMGMTLPEAASALGRAYAGGAGAADIFRERGILQVLKDAAKLKYGIDDLSKVSLPEFRKIMLETFTDTDGRIAGAADKLAKTWDGMISMLSDAWYRFRGAVMKAGLFDFLKQSLQEVLDWIKQKEQDGSFTRWAKALSDAAVNAFKTVKTWVKDLADWWNGPDGQALFEGMKMLAGVLAKIVSFVPKIPTAFMAPWNLSGKLFGMPQEMPPAELNETFRKYLSVAPTTYTGYMGGAMGLTGRDISEYMASIAPLNIAKEQLKFVDEIFKKTDDAHAKLMSDMVQRETRYYINKARAENTIYARIQRLRLNDKQYALWALDQEVKALRAKGADELLIRQYFGLQTREINKTAIDHMIDDMTDYNKQLERFTIDTVRTIQSGFKSMFRELIETGKVSWKTIFDILIDIASNALSRLGNMLAGGLLDLILGKSGGGGGIGGNIGSNILGKVVGGLLDKLGLRNLFGAGGSTMGIPSSTLTGLTNAIGSGGGLGNLGMGAGGISGFVPLANGGLLAVAGTSMPDLTLASGLGPLSASDLIWPASGFGGGATTTGGGLGAATSGFTAGLASALGIGGFSLFAGGALAMIIKSLGGKPPAYYTDQIKRYGQALEGEAAKGLRAVNHEMEIWINYMDNARQKSTLTKEQYEAMWAGASEAVRQYRAQVEETRKVSEHLGYRKETDIGPMITGKFLTELDTSSLAYGTAGVLKEIQKEARALAQELGLDTEAVERFIKTLEPTTESLMMAQDQFREWANQIGAAKFQTQELTALMQETADVNSPAFTEAIAKAADAIGLSSGGAEALKGQLAQIADQFKAGQISAADLSSTIEGVLIGSINTTINALARASSAAGSFGSQLRAIPDKVSTIVETHYVTSGQQAIIGHKGGDVANLPRYHQGGLNSDERIIVGQTGEVFWSRADNARWGGAANVDRLRRMGPGGLRNIGSGGINVYLSVNGLTLDDPPTRKRAARALSREIETELNRRSRLRVGG